MAGATTINRQTVHYLLKARSNDLESLLRVLGRGAREVFVAIDFHSVLVPLSC